jgi:hypothetical protein
MCPCMYDTVPSDSHKLGSVITHTVPSRHSLHPIEAVSWNYVGCLKAADIDVSCA